VRRKFEFLFIISYLFFYDKLNFITKTYTGQFCVSFVAYYPFLFFNLSFRLFVFIVELLFVCACQVEVGLIRFFDSFTTIANYYYFDIDSYDNLNNFNNGSNYFTNVNLINSLNCIDDRSSYDATNDVTAVSGGNKNNAQQSSNSGIADVKIGNVCYNVTKVDQINLRKILESNLVKDDAEISQLQLTRGLYKSLAVRFGSAYSYHPVAVLVDSVGLKCIVREGYVPTYYFTHYTGGLVGGIVTDDGESCLIINNSLYDSLLKLDSCANAIKENTHVSLKNIGFRATISNILDVDSGVTKNTPLYVLNDDYYENVLISGVVKKGLMKSEASNPFYIEGVSRRILNSDNIKLGPFLQSGFEASKENRVDIYSKSHDFLRVFNATYDLAGKPRIQMINSKSFAYPVDSFANQFLCNTKNPSIFLNKEYTVNFNDLIKSQKISSATLESTIVNLTQHTISFITKLKFW